MVLATRANSSVLRPSGIEKEIERVITANWEPRAHFVGVCIVNYNTTCVLFTSGITDVSR